MSCQNHYWRTSKDKRHIIQPNKNMYVIGISALYHDSSVCLFRDNQLIFACEEEKFTGIKHDSSFPVMALDYIYKNGVM